MKGGQRDRRGERDGQALRVSQDRRDLLGHRDFQGIWAQPELQEVRGPWDRREWERRVSEERWEREGYLAWPACPDPPVHQESWGSLAKMAQREKRGNLEQLGRQGSQGQRVTQEEQEKREPRASVDCPGSPWEAWERAAAWRCLDNLVPPAHGENEDTPEPQDLPALLESQEHQELGLKLLISMRSRG